MWFKAYSYVYIYKLFAVNPNMHEEEDVHGLESIANSGLVSHGLGYLLA